MNTALVAESGSSARYSNGVYKFTIQIPTVNNFLCTYLASSIDPFDSNMFRKAGRAGIHFFTGLN